MSDEQIKNYIIDKYFLYDETAVEVDENGEPILDSNGNTMPKKLDIVSDKIKITGEKDSSGNYIGNVHISISGLDEITEDGRAKEYFSAETNRR